MEKYPIILEKKIIPEKNQALLTLFIPEVLDYFCGHFPNYPVLPGIVQVNWVIEFVQSLFNIESINIQKIDQLKFMRVILPNSKINLSFVINNQRIIFKYYNEDDYFSSGKITFSKNAN